MKRVHLPLLSNRSSKVIRNSAHSSGCRCCRSGGIWVHGNGLWYRSDIARSTCCAVKADSADWVSEKFQLLDILRSFCYLSFLLCNLFCCGCNSNVWSSGSSEWLFPSNSLAFCCFCLISLYCTGLFKTLCIFFVVFLVVSVVYLVRDRGYQRPAPFKSFILFGPQARSFFRKDTAISALFRTSLVCSSPWAAASATCPFPAL